MRHCACGFFASYLKMLFHLYVFFLLWLSDAPGTTTFMMEGLMHVEQNKRTNKLRGLQSAGELYRLSDRRLSDKLVSTFVDRRMWRSQRGGSPKAVISAF
jgi:hypothetical protein